MNKQAFVGFRLSGEEAAQLDAAAKAAGVGRSAYVRARVFGYPLPNRQERAGRVGEVWAEMTRAQNNLGQILRKVPDTDDTKALLAKRAGFLDEALRRAADRATVCILPPEAIEAAKTAGNRLNDIAADLNAAGFQAGATHAALDAFKAFFLATRDAWRAVDLSKSQEG